MADALDAIEAALLDRNLRGFTCYFHPEGWMISLRTEEGYDTKYRVGPLSEALPSAFSDPAQSNVPEDDWMDLI